MSFPFSTIRHLQFPVFLGFIGSLSAEESTDKVLSAPGHFDVYPKIASETKLELWAKSDMVRSPIAIDIDPQGRVWATEGILQDDGDESGSL